MRKTQVSKATLGRLPDYLKTLQGISLDRYPNISATTIAKALNFGEVQVRKDLAVVGCKGKPKVGYPTKSLIEGLEEFLGCGKQTPVVLVGTGKLGHALLNYDEFSKYGVKIVAAFDCDDKVIDGENNPKIMPMNRFKDYCHENGIRIGIITVDKSSAQEVCDLMVGCGIAAIWNFAPCKLKAPSDVLVENENLALSLASLNNVLRKQ